MSPDFAPSVDAAIHALRPDYVALSIVARDVTNADSVAAIARPSLWAEGTLARPEWSEAHLQAWRDAYRAFGAKPQRTPPSADALTARILRDGALPGINPVVDLYNTLSVAYAIPIGGEDIDAYRGNPRLHVSTGNELFDTVKDSAPFQEPVPAGEVVWSDAEGVTCRRWNWRQGTRTRIESATTQMWFVLERLEPMPLESLLRAGRILADGLRTSSATARVFSTLVDRHGLHSLVL